ncbi:hypothetical protein BC826DRAFT_976794, partial [Russula brevipes]
YSSSTTIATRSTSLPLAEQEPLRAIQVPDVGPSSTPLLPPTETGVVPTATSSTETAIVPTATPSTETAIVPAATPSTSTSSTHQLHAKKSKKARAMNGNNPKSICKRQWITSNPQGTEAEFAKHWESLGNAGQKVYVEQSKAHVRTE